MAKSPTAAKRARAPKKPVDPAAALLKAAFMAAEDKGWRRVHISAVAKAAGLSVAEAYRIAPDREALLDLYAERIDAVMAEELEGDGGVGAWRDRAFDGFMMRFDAMLPDRDALRVVFYDSRRDPLAMARAAFRARRSLERVLEIAGLAEDRIALRAGTLAFMPLYARLMRVWLGDEEDQARTMASLDKMLGRLAKLIRRFTPRRDAEAEIVDDDLDVVDLEDVSADKSVH